MAKATKEEKAVAKARAAAEKADAEKLAARMEAKAKVEAEKAEADAHAAKEAAQARADAMDDVAEREPGAYICEGKSCTSAVGVLGPGARVEAKFFIDGEAAIERLVKGGHAEIVK